MEVGFESGSKHFKPTDTGISTNESNSSLGLKDRLSSKKILDYGNDSKEEAEGETKITNRSGEDVLGKVDADVDDYQEDKIDSMNDDDKVSNPKLGTTSRLRRSSSELSFESEQRNSQDSVKRKRDESQSPVEDEGKLESIEIQSSTLDENSKRRKMSSASDTVIPPVAVSSAVTDVGKSSTNNSRTKDEENQMSASPSTSSQNGEKNEVVSSHVHLPPIGSITATLPALNQKELNELEIALGIIKKNPQRENQADDDGDGSWKEDWSGNLSLVDKEIANPVVKSRKQNGAFKQSMLHWARNGNRQCVKILQYLIRFVYHQKGTPQTAKQIFANADPNSLQEMEYAARRVLYDPSVLQQDGWTTAKAKEPVGATGGAYRIGDQVRWQNFDAVVIAYIHDQDMGDLWRAIWIDDGVETFDLEAEELVEARKNWEREREKEKQKKSSAQSAESSRRSSRFLADRDFNVKGVEFGIVLAASYCRGARPGVYWPARVMHASEMEKSTSKSKRSAPRQRLDVVFLAPYWNSNLLAMNSSRRDAFKENLSNQAESKYSSGPLFDIENIDASDEMIKEYPYDGSDGVDIDQLRVAFRFTGLPKAVFKRFLDSHRLALALKAYAKMHITSTLTKSDRASAGLFETHPLSVQAPIYPLEILHLPFQFILSKLPPPSGDEFSMTYDDEKNKMEPLLKLQAIVNAMKPPNCWGQEKEDLSQEPDTSPMHNGRLRVAESPSISAGIALLKASKQGCAPLEIDHFISDLKELRAFILNGNSCRSLGVLIDSLKDLLSSLSCETDSDLGSKKVNVRSRSLFNSWALTKNLGDEAIGATVGCSKMIIAEWRRACERIYKYITHVFSHPGYGNGVSTVLTDGRCNSHITSSGCFERQVRLPAALRATRRVGAGIKENIRLFTTIEDFYIKIAESEVAVKAHSASYLKRMKGKCSVLTNDTEVVPLTEDSEGNGGEDTKGSRGTWMAAVASVAAAVKAVDMVVRGECVNAFCITRPPGHHAGRELHSMKAVSNGFCILNTAACAALHATTPTADGGPGLKRVCVIDFDVHHGNGTQDVLCSTYDPRFLYVSLHAGGADVNGVAPEDEFDKELHCPGGTSKLKGIYPGRCGDTSPHKGVLNIPLGPKVTSHAVGTALIGHVTPAVDAFSPDIIILSAGFDAHKHDPLGLGGLSAEDFGHITEAVCQMAFKCCSGRVVSVLEGGYGVPCCRRQRSTFVPLSSLYCEPTNESNIERQTEVQGSDNDSGAVNDSSVQQRPQPSKLLDLGDDLPLEMDDQLPYVLQQRLEKCHVEGFMHCIEAHVRSLAKCNKRS